jgi:Protein of unknown function (DUF1598)
MAFNQEPFMLKIQQSGFFHIANHRNSSLTISTLKYMSCFFVACGLLLIASVADLQAAEDQSANNKLSNSVESEISANLLAGEFSNALKIAMSVEDAGKKSELLQEIAIAQQDAGDFNASLASIRKIPASTVRTENRRALSKEKTSHNLAGGGGGEGVLELIELIQEVTGTSETWSEDDEEGGIIIEWSPSTVSGVMVDPRGVLQQSTKEKGKRLATLSNQVRRADLNADMAKTSKLRLVSLTRLEKLIAKNRSEGKPVYATLKQLAGLTRVQYIFVYPEENEIVIGGPAEAWEYNQAGQMVGVESGRPVLHLDDLVTVMRTFSDDGQSIFNCLIVPREENIRNLNSYVTKTNKVSRSPVGTRKWVKQLENVLGTQDVIFNGIPTDSRVARTIIEADYRMKLIGIDKLHEANIPSYFDLLAKEDRKGPQMVDALRWWLTMNYDSVLLSQDENSFEIRGSSVKCLSENELITKQGKRISTGKANATNQLFAEHFSQKYEELASADPVFADLQNVFDLSLVAALIKHYQLDDKTNWSRGVFMKDGGYQTSIYTPVTTAQTVANHRVYNKRNVIVQVAGGVRGDLMSVVSDNKVIKKGSTQSINRPALPEGRWWWDVSEKE